MASHLTLKTKEEFQRFVEGVEQRQGYHRPFAFALGVETLWQSELGDEAKVLDTRFVAINVGENYGTWAVLVDVVDEMSATVELDDRELRYAESASTPSSARTATATSTRCGSSVRSSTGIPSSSRARSEPACRCSW